MPHLNLVYFLLGWRSFFTCMYLLLVLNLLVVWLTSIWNYMHDGLPFIPSAETCSTSWDQRDQSGSDQKAVIYSYRVPRAPWLFPGAPPPSFFCPDQSRMSCWTEYSLLTQINIFQPISHEIPRLHWSVHYQEDKSLDMFQITTICVVCLLHQLCIES